MNSCINTGQRSTHSAWVFQSSSNNTWIYQKFQPLLVEICNYEMNFICNLIHILLETLTEKTAAIGKEQCSNSPITCYISNRCSGFSIKHIVYTNSFDQKLTWQLQSSCTLKNNIYRSVEFLMISCIIILASNQKKHMYSVTLRFEFIPESSFTSSISSAGDRKTAAI